MPIYDYRCEACGHEFEDLRGFNDPDPDGCPECGKDAVKKLITGGNFQLKGSGWYVTDYAGKSKKGKKEKSAESSESASESSESSSDNTTSESSSSGGADGSSSSDGEAA